MPLRAPVVVESERLIVRPVAEADLQALLAVNGDDEATRDCFHIPSIADTGRMLKCFLLVR